MNESAQGQRLNECAESESSGSLDETHHILYIVGPKCDQTQSNVLADPILLATQDGKKLQTANCKCIMKLQLTLL